MERSLGKQRILELYLNMVELGPGIYGAGPAARAYFVKRPAGLLPEEAAFLAGILNSPRTAWKTQYLTDQPATGRVQWVVRNMANLDDETRAAALTRPIRFVPP
jgi:monofunctional biosynthetic peptidoglycan transglycosylase